MKRKVGIIGAGLGGLSAAIYLAQNPDLEIHIFDKNDKPGGKLGEINSDGFRFDTGPSVVTLIDVIKDLFVAAGENPDSHLDFIRLDPVNRNFFDDGSFVDSLSDLKDFETEINKFDPKSASNLKDYIRHIKGIFDHTNEIFIYSPLHEIKYLIQNNKIPNLLNFLKIDAFSTMHSANKRFFKHPKVLQIFDRYATYNGSSPYLAPGTLNLISYVELVVGAFYVKGGIAEIVRKIEYLAIKSGVHFHLNSYVDEIIIQNKTATSLRSNDEVIDFDFIISNSDVVYTYQNLIKGFDRKRTKCSKVEPSISGMVFLWGVSGTHNKLTHHNVFYSNDYQNEFKQIFDDKTAPDDPTIYIAVTSKTDPDHAPDNCENWFVLINMPYNENQNWDELSKLVREKIFQKLIKHNIDIEKSIMFEKIFTPADLETKYLSNRGSIYGISSNSMLSAFKRHSNRSFDIRNLYFAGGSAHPGGGIPLVILSGKHCADIILRNLN